MYASYRLNAGALFVGNLRVVRMTDGRVLYPYVGAPTVGPFNLKEEAYAASIALANKLIDDDIKSPEP